ncbi:MAG: DUF2207 domain-containing protein [Streptosporangiales bacterium]|nr:DUF2207 domain-containing protein [Streptosporangiales bacterium]
MRRLLRRCAAAGVAAVAVLTFAPQATARDVGERITSYDVSMRVGDDGSMTVEETVDYDFGTSTDKHGFYRDLVTRMDYDRYNYRHYPVDDIKVSSPTGAPDDLSIDEGDTSTRIRIGDAGDTTSGQQRYTISYRVEGVLNGFSDHVELYWNVLGTGFDAPIDSATATVETPGDDVTRVECYAGEQGSKSSCATKTRSADTASFSADSLDADEAFTVVVGMPKGSATATPILTERPSWRTDFGPGIANVAGVVLAAAAAVLLWLLLRRKRREHAADASSAAPASGSGVLRQQPDGSVTFAPPGGLRPGQVGTLDDDKADTIDVTATIVDLAVRGYLVIDELPDGDWGLRMLRAPGPEFLPYERRFFDALFLGKPDRVRMSDLKNKFASTLGSIKDLMYSDMAQRGWFTSRKPRTVKTLWWVLGGVVGGIGLIVLMSIAQGGHTPFGTGAVALVLLGGGIVYGARLIPAKTVAGAQAHAQVQAFRDEMAALDFSRLPEGSRDEIMSRYLPYAMAFGQTNQWTAAFAQLESEQYDGRRGGSMYWFGMYNGWDAHRFGQTMTSFSTSTSGVMASTPGGSGSSGFSGGGGGSSGGGGGGGGGGSW